MDGLMVLLYNNSKGVHYAVKSTTPKKVRRRRKPMSEEQMAAAIESG